MYQNLAQQYQYQTGQPPPVIDEHQAQQHFEEFYEDVWTELSNFGELEELHVCNNLGDHLIGNVYAKFYDEDSAAAAQQALQGRFYARRMLTCEFSPVTDFREARCRQFDNGECVFGGYCNFMHLYHLSSDLERRINRTRRRRRSRSPRDRDRRDRDRDRDYRRRDSRSPDRRRRYDRDRERDRSRDRHRRSHRERSRERSGRERERERERDSSGERERERERDRDQDSGRDYEHTREREREQNTPEHQSRERERDHSPSHNQDAFDGAPGNHE